MEDDHKSSEKEPSRAAEAPDPEKEEEDKPSASKPAAPAAQAADSTDPEAADEASPGSGSASDPGPSSEPEPAGGEGDGAPSDRAAASAEATDPGAVFEHDDSFEAGEVSGNLELERYEVIYQELYASALKDGVITSEERAKLQQAADAMGLDRERLHELEKTLSAAYAAQSGLGVLDTSKMFAPSEPETADHERGMPSYLVGDTAADPVVIKLQQQVEQLRKRVISLERELEHVHAQSDADVLVDYSELPAELSPDDPEALHRRLKHDPRDVITLRALFRAAGSNDRRWCVAHALDYLGRADDEVRQCLRSGPGAGLIQPSSSLTSDDWRGLLRHPDEDVITGEILSLIVSAVLFGHVSVLRHHGKLPDVNAKTRLDPEHSSVPAARSFHWAAQILGMQAPPLFEAPMLREKLVQMVPAVPPITKLGRDLLCRRGEKELAFVAGWHLALYRQERFVRLLAPDIIELTDLFLAALSIAKPTLPLPGDVRKRVRPIAEAIKSLLKEEEVGQLYAAWCRFIDQGGRTNLKRWAWAADGTALCAGLLLSSDLRVAETMLKLEGRHHIERHMDDLLVFQTSDRYAKLRQRIGIALP